MAYNKEMYKYVYFVLLVSNYYTDVNSKSFFSSNKVQYETLQFVGINLKVSRKCSKYLFPQ